MAVAQLAQRSEQTVAYLFCIDGIRHMWSNVRDLCGSGGGSWIGTDYGDRVVLLGHGGGGNPMLPDTISTGIDLDTGMLRDGSLDISIADRDGVLIALMKEPDELDFFATRLSPLDSPAPPTLVGFGGDTIDVHGRCVGAETIGPAGERHRYNCIVGSTLPGLDHAAIDSAEATIAPSTITDDPEYLSGRRCALYIIRRDPTTGQDGPDSWPSWQDQADSGYSLVWWGTVQRVTNEGHVFKFACDGPDSWLRKSLNTTSPSEWRPLSAPLHLRTDVGAREDLMAIGFHYASPFDAGDNRRCGYSLFDATDDVIGNDQDVGGVLGDIASRLSTLSTAAGPDATWTSYRNAAYTFDLNGLAVRTDDDSPALIASVKICLHEKVWRFLGYDPVLQARGIDEVESEFDIFISPALEQFKPYNDYSAPVPGPGYYTFYFGTLPIGETAASASIDCDNAGKWRTYRPLVEAGTVMLFPEAKQTISLGFQSAPYCTGQVARPVALHEIDAAPCDRTGWMVFRGPYRESLDEDPRDLYQVAKVSWVNDGETFAVDGSGRRSVFIEKWLDPRLFGFTDKPITKVWSATTLEWAVLAVVGYNTSGLDRADLVLLRLLLSTGTKLWDSGSYEDVDGATADPGANGHPDAVAPHLEGDDRDIADLGLAIPYELVDWGSFITAANGIPGGGWKSALNRVKVCYQGQFDSQELIEQLIRPRALMLSLHGYKFGLWNLSVPLDADDAQVVIGEGDLDSTQFPYVPSVDLSPLTGFDKGSLDYHIAPTGGGESTTLDIKPLSPRVRARHGNSSLELTGRGMVDLRHWLGDDDAKKPPHWLSDFRQLLNVTMADYLLQPHEMLVGLPVRTPKANQLNPGTVVLLTNAWPATRTGSYGMIGRVGRVVSVRRDTNHLTATCDILVQAGDANTKRRFAPIAAIVDDVDTLEERHDPATRTLFCYGDRFGAEGGSDVKYFAEPSWSSLGGNALVYGYSYDGVEWVKRFQFEVESVDTSAHTITYVDGSFSGTFKERQYHVLMLAPWDDQTAAWPKALFLVTTNSSGKHSAGPIKGFPLVT